MKIIWLAVSICFLIALGGSDCGGTARNAILDDKMCDSMVKTGLCFTSQKPPQSEVEARKQNCIKKLNHSTACTEPAMEEVGRFLDCVSNDCSPTTVMGQMTECGKKFDSAKADAVKACMDEFK